MAHGINVQICDILSMSFLRIVNVVSDQSLSFHGLCSCKPLLLALIFTRCSGVCNPFLLELKENIQFKGKGKSFNILVLSFDPRDSIEDMQVLAQRYRLENDNQWFFGVTENIEALNRSIGFYPVWDSLSKQYDHDALLVGINSDGYITKKLIGIRKGHDLDLMIASVNNVFSPTYKMPNKNMLFSCFNYDPITGENRLGFGLLIIALSAVLTVMLLLSVNFFVRR